MERRALHGLARHGAGKLEWANPDYLAALEAKSLDQALQRNLQLDQGATDLARKAIEAGAAVEETRSAVVGGSSARCASA